MFKEILQNTKENTPLIHCITNYVTVNDVANTVLAIGASPIMSHEKKEVEEIVSISDALTINIGTCDDNISPSMRIAMQKANDMDKPIVFDPVGSGASKYRTSLTKEFVNNYKIAVIRGNASEISSFVEESDSTKGVDVSESDTVTEDNLSQKIDFVKKAALQYNTIIAMSGKIDLVTDGNKCYVIRNGNSMMKEVTGTGCMLSALTASLVAKNKNKLEASVTAVLIMGIAGEIAKEKLKEDEGNSTYRNKLIDAIYNMTDAKIKEYAKYEIK
ncbi:MAG: hydroxyethylthiazole kinase [Tissierellia bacterium]|nr:hydroxyethylthiazole kinase [Tissierellia bacterium]